LQKVRSRWPSISYSLFCQNFLPIRHVLLLLSALECIEQCGD
jgi:hypothetical protein